MIKIFCDRCGKETKENMVSQRLSTVIQNKIGADCLLEIMLGVNGVWNSGVICRDCLLEMLKELK